MMSILFREHRTKNIEIEKIVFAMGHYDTIVQKITQLQGRSLVKRLTLQHLSHIPVKSGQPLQMVIHQKRAKLTSLVLRCRNANEDKD